MENIETERNVVDVISDEIKMVMNNNNNNNEAIKATDKVGLRLEPTIIENLAENVEQTDEITNDKTEHLEPIEEGSTNATDNGDARIEQNEPTNEGDLKVDDTTASETSDEKTESSEPSEPSSYATGSESKDDTQTESESSGTSENTDEIRTENTVETTEQIEQNGEIQESKSETEENEEEEEGEVSTVTDTPKDDAQPTAEQKDDEADKTAKNDSTKRSPRKKGTNKKRSKNRPQKKQTDYSGLDNYTVSVSQRQRRYSLIVPRGRTIEAPSDDCEIFCTNIPINVLEGELIPLFERYGKIWELRLMMSMRNPKRNAGFAFVRYTSNESAMDATEKLNNYEILPGKHLAIRLSQPNLSLFVGNIHRGLTREQIHEKIGNRTSGLVKTFVKTSLYEDTKNCGFCFLEYDSHASALQAKRTLNYGNVWGRQLFVDWAQRRKQPEESDLTDSKTLFINNLPKETTDQIITDTLSTYGNIEKVTKIKDYAFVLFDEQQSATNAMNSIDKVKLGNEKIEISLAMPKSLKSSRPRFASFPSYRHNDRHNRSGNNRRFNKRYNTSLGSTTPSHKFYMHKQQKPKNVRGNDENEATGQQTMFPTIVINPPTH